MSKYNLKNGEFLFTSESVAEGHPDKICDQISDLILDEFLKNDPNAKVALEAMVIPQHVILSGEISSKHFIPLSTIEGLVRQKIREIGYEQDSFHWEKLKILDFLKEQSPDIALGVDGKNGQEEGAGDQGLMFGYACKDTKNFMPAPITYAHEILKNIMNALRAKKINGLFTDAKSQVSVTYDKEGKPIKTDSIVVSIHHHPDLTQEEVKKLIYPYVEATLPEGWMCPDEKFLVNPTGRFVIGGPASDAGLTGRKIIVDTYGGAAPHGGGAFSGKDPSKVDRSAAYMARYLAKNIVAAGIAERCTIQIAYAIGIAQPLSLYINTHRTSKLSNQLILNIISEIIDLSPRGIRSYLKLDKPIYSKTSVYGHFGKQADDQGHFSWEKLDLVEELRARLL